ncbi:MAG: adenosine kinase [Myxococcota bacterium]|nr:adenosine kinase [Myxococcota bacterium]
MYDRNANLDRRIDVAGLGNALVDALVVMDDRDFLARHGFTRGHMTPVDHAQWQTAFEEVERHGVEIQSGGSCANSIAALGLMGATSTYCGQVGDDPFGSLYASRMREACGETALKRTRDHNTGKCLSIISSEDAERTMLTDLGAAVTMDGLGDFADVIRRSKVLHLTGYLLLGEPMASRAMEAVAVAAQEQIPISLDVADPFVVGVTRDAMWELIEEFADIVFCNEEEAKALCGVENAEDAMMSLGEACETVVVKLGARGAVVRSGGRDHRIGIHACDAKDTTGAGDAFAAGFLYGYVHGWDPVRAGDLGARIASATVAQVGAVVRDRDQLAAAVAAARG